MRFSNTPGRILVRHGPCFAGCVTSETASRLRVWTDARRDPTRQCREHNCLKVERWPDTFQQYRNQIKLWIVGLMATIRSARSFVKVEGQSHEKLQLQQ